MGCDCLDGLRICVSLAVGPSSDLAEPVVGLFKAGLVDGPECELDIWEVRRGEKEVGAKKTKSDSIVDELRQAILAGHFGPGDWLRQETLAEMHGTSHIPVREALNRLEAEGFVERIPHRGAKVVTYDMGVAEVYYDLRALLEPYAVEIAVKDLTPEDLGELKGLLHRAEELLGKDELTELTEVNWQFHEWLIEHCGSRLVQDVLARVRRSFRMDTLLMIPERAEASVKEHRAIYEALQAGQPDEAMRLMRENIVNAKAAMFERLPALAGRGEKAS